MPDTSSSPEWLTPKQLAGLFQISESTLANWRWAGTGPKCSKIGGHIRYRRSDVDAWAEAQAQPVAG